MIILIVEIHFEDDLGFLLNSVCKVDIDLSFQKFEGHDDESIKLKYLLLVFCSFLELVLKLPNHDKVVKDCKSMKKGAAAAGVEIITFSRF